jgi:hypothetical protein
MTLISIKLHLVIFTFNKMFIMLKHVFYDLFHATIMSNMIKEMTKFFF